MSFNQSSYFKPALFGTHFGHAYRSNKGARPCINMPRYIIRRHYTQCGSLKSVLPTSRINRIMQNGICNACSRVRFKWCFHPQSPGRPFRFQLHYFITLHPCKPNLPVWVVGWLFWPHFRLRLQFKQWLGFIAI